jgi:crotonobetainyl-CoA:carnitine CoA-transferase CaiB-like acyl-CoA transferase
MIDLPLDGLVVLEFSQYLSAPSAGLRLADLGARVIKIERPVAGDAGRKLPVKNLWVDDNSLLFHTINRNKESFTADLKNEEDFSIVKKLIAKADVIIHNFRPGVMERTGLGYEAVKKMNQRIIYASISGYGNEGPWKSKPGQDLLLQSMTGIAWTTGNAADVPMPFGISVCDILCGAQLVQGILGGLIRRQKTGSGALIEISMMESIIDFQFELLTTYFASGKQPQRSAINNGHPLLSAPYGIYVTTDGYIALAMMDIHVLAKAINCPGLNPFLKEEIFAKRDEIKNILAAHLSTHTTEYWLQHLQEQDLWAMEVFDWEQMINHDAYKILEMEQTIKSGDREIITTRCPIRLNGKKIFSDKAAPLLGEHNESVYNDFIKQ